MSVEEWDTVKGFVEAWKEVHKKKKPKKAQGKTPNKSETPQKGGLCLHRNALEELGGVRSKSSS